MLTMLSGANKMRKTMALSVALNSYKSEWMKLDLFYVIIAKMDFWWKFLAFQCSSKQIRLHLSWVWHAVAASMVSWFWWNRISSIFPIPLAFGLCACLWTWLRCVINGFMKFCCGIRFIANFVSKRKEIEPFEVHQNTFQHELTAISLIKFNGVMFQLFCTAVPIVMQIQSSNTSTRTHKARESERIGCLMLILLRLVLSMDG